MEVIYYRQLVEQAASEGPMAATLRRCSAGIALALLVLAISGGCAPAAPLPDAAANQDGAAELGTGDDVAEVIGDDTGWDAVEADSASGPEVAPIDHDAEPYCHHDCVALNACQDGKVKTYSNVPVPCKFWKGECVLDGPPLQCQQGCRTDMGANPTYDPAWPAQNLCAESVAKAVGSPCQSDADCQGAAKWVNYAPVNVYLSCDASITGTCAAAPPPLLADWGETCGLKGLGKYRTYTPASILLAPTCATGACFVQGGWACSVGVRAGCTKPCAHDWDCPQGALCESVQTAQPSGNFKDMLHCVPVAKPPGMPPWYCRTDVL